MTRLILGTRGSALALAQVDLTRAALAEAWPELLVERQIFVTRGDQKLDLSLLRAGEAGGKGLFTKELEDALLAGTIDVAVHSLKDLPGHNPPGLEVAAVLKRASTADVLITHEVAQAPRLPAALTQPPRLLAETGESPAERLPAGGAPALLPSDASFDALEKGARIGTSSVRRARQLQWLRPDLQIEEWRGNVPTRLRKLSQRADLAGIVLAQAGLERLGFSPATGVIEFEGARFHAISLAELLLPAIGQGAIALQARADRADVLAVLAAINHAPTFTCIRAEREVQRLLAGDCGMPVGVRATLEDAALHLSAILFSEKSEPPARAEASGPASNPEALAAELFARLTPSSQAHAYEKI